MNTNLLKAVKQIILQNGARILDDSRNMNLLLSEKAAGEPKPQRMALVKCLMNNQHKKLQNAQNLADCKIQLVQELHNGAGIDQSLCYDTLDLVEMILFNTVTTVSTSVLPVQIAPIPAPSPHKEIGKAIDQQHDRSMLEDMTEYVDFVVLDDD